MGDYKKAIELHEKHGGKIEVNGLVPLDTREDLSLAYSPGVAGPCIDIAEDPERVWDVTMKGRTVAVVTDGSAVLGLGDIGPHAALPVMEGKCALFKKFAGVDAVPLCLDTQDTQEIVETVARIAPAYGGINLEDIAAPRCFEIEEKLREKLDIPVMHDDQHGTAVVTLAGLINALTLRETDREDARVVIVGSGAAGVAIAKILVAYDITDIVMCDSKGIISAEREDLNPSKKALLSFTNKDNISGTLEDAVKERNIFIGVSQPGLLSRTLIATMQPDPIIFAMANPEPEILPEKAYEAGALVVATGRSDYPNQINNVLAFPGIFKGALRARAQFREEVFIRAAEALAASVEEINREHIIPDPFDVRVPEALQEVVYQTLKK